MERYSRTLAASESLPRPEITSEQWELLSKTLKAVRDPETDRPVFVGTYTEAATLSQKYNDHEAVVILHNDEIVAYGMLRAAETWDELGTIFVHPSYQGCAYSVKIVCALRSLAATRRHAVFGITANAAMAKIFERIGLTEVASNPSDIEHWLRGQHILEHLSARRFDQGRRLFSEMRHLSSSNLPSEDDETDDREE